MTAVTASSAARRLALAPRTAMARLLFALVVLTMLCLFCAPLFVDDSASNAPKAHLGAMSFARWKTWDKVVPLEGDWLVTWQSPELPNGPKTGDVALVPAPGEWAGHVTAGGSRLPRLGRAVYHLTLKGVPRGDYTLSVPGYAYASRVLVNERQVSARGLVGDTAETTRPLARPQVVPIHADGGDLAIAIDVAAFHHFSDGLDMTPAFGAAPVMDVWLSLQSAQQLLFIVTLIVLFFYGAVVWIFRSDDLASLYFALACLFLIPTAMIIGHENLMVLEFPGLSFPTIMAIEYITCLLCLMFLLSYTHALFPRESSRWIVRGFLAVFSVSIVALAWVLLHGDTYTAAFIDRYPIFVGALELAYIIGVVALATIRQRDGAAVFLLGVTIFAMTAVQVILVEDDVIPQDQVPLYAFAPMGMVIFSFCHIIILAERWSQAMRVVETTASDLRGLMEVSGSINTELRLDVLLRKLVEATSRFLHAERSTLFLHDPKTDELWSMVAEGLETREIRIAADSGIAGACFQSGEVSMVADAYRDPRFSPTVDQTTGHRTRAVLSAPIVTREGRRLGVMQALNSRPFQPADAERIRAFAAQIAVALENASLFSGIVAARNYSESILASMSGGVITLNAEGQVETINAAAAHILEVDAEAMKGVAAKDYLSEADAWLLDEFEAVRAAGVPRALMDVEIQTGTGRPVAVNSSIVPLINDKAPAGLLLLFEDISQEKRLKGAMRRFMTQKVVDQVLDRQDELMFGSACVASVLFADIRGFTSMAESLKARETVDMLNEVFTDLVEAVSANDGVVDKFIGDAVMAVFGAPISSGRDTAHAVESANAMMLMIASLNRRREARGDPPLRLGVGVATGELVAGTIGSPKRMDYTVIGDSVNLASRLQDLTKQYGVGVILSETTALEGGEGQILRRLDTVGVRGRNRAERIYQLMTYHTEETFPRLGEVAAAYERGLEASETGDWRLAVACFREALTLNPDDRPSEIMLDRAKAALAALTGGMAAAGR